jgi:hypothetical protein
MSLGWGEGSWGSNGWGGTLELTGVNANGQVGTLVPNVIIALSGVGAKTRIL